MPLDLIPKPSTQEIETELDALFAPDEPKKGRHRKTMDFSRKKAPFVVEETFLDPEEYLFSKNTELGEIHEYLMGIFVEEGKAPGDVLEMGYRISSREDCTFSMLQVCNALADLAQVGKIRVKQVVKTNDKFHLYGLWTDEGN